MSFSNTATTRTALQGSNVLQPHLIIISLPSHTMHNLYISSLNPRFPPIPTHPIHHPSVLPRPQYNPPLTSTLHPNLPPQQNPPTPLPPPDSCYRSRSPSHSQDTRPTCPAQHRPALSFPAYAHYRVARAREREAGFKSLMLVEKGPRCHQEGV